MLNTAQGKLIVGFILLIVLCVSVVFTFAVDRYREEFLSYIRSYFSDMVTQISHNIEHQVMQAEELTFNVLSDKTIQNNLEQLIADVNADLSTMQTQKLVFEIERHLELFTLYSNDILSLSVITPEDREITIQRVQNEPIRKAFTWEEAYAALGSTIWGMYEDDSIVVERAIYSLLTMKPIGYINLVYDNDFFNDIISDMSINFTNIIYVVDDQNTVICSNDATMIGQTYPISKEETIIKAHNEESGYTDYLYQSSPLFNGWSIVVNVPSKNLRENIEQFLRQCLWVSMLIFVLAVMICILTVRHIVKPMLELSEMMRRFGEGEHNLRTPHVKQDEIGHIGRAYNHMAENIETLLRNVLQLQLAQKQAEIEYLKMHVNPHFLYNTLDTINWLGVLHNERDISQISCSLATLLRSSIKGEANITVTQEVAFIEDYLRIQHYRFANRIDARFDIDEDCMTVMIPKFILQPIVENAIIHGLEPKVGKGMITIDIHSVKDQVRFMVSDNGVGMSEVQIAQWYEKCDSSNSLDITGLINVYRRLELLYGEGSRLRLCPRDGGGLCVTFEIPRE